MDTGTIHYSHVNDKEKCEASPTSSPHHTTTPPHHHCITSPYPTTAISK